MCKLGARGRLTEITGVLLQELLLDRFGHSFLTVVSITTVLTLRLLLLLLLLLRVLDLRVALLLLLLLRCLFLVR